MKELNELELKNEIKLQNLRDKRALLLKKFDIYTKNVAYGLIYETPQRHQIIVDWYNKLLDITKTMDESVLTNYPRELEKY